MAHTENRTEILMENYLLKAVKSYFSLFNKIPVQISINLEDSFTHGSNKLFLFKFKRIIKLDKMKFIYIFFGNENFYIKFCSYN